MQQGRILAATGMHGFITSVACMLMACGASVRAGTVTIDWDNGARQVVSFDEREGQASHPTTTASTRPSDNQTTADKGSSPGDQGATGKASSHGDGLALTEAVAANEVPAAPVVATGWLASNRTVVVPSGTYLVNFNLAGVHDLTIQWDGKGTKPILQATGGGSSMIVFDATSRNITFDGFVIDAGSRNAFVLAGKDLTFRNLEFKSCTDAFLAERSVDGVLIDRCAVVGDTAMTSYFLWMGAGESTIQNVTVRNCVVPNSTRQHIVRAHFGTIQNILIENCDFTNKDRRTIDPQDDAKHTFFIQQMDGLTIRNCKLRDGSLVLGPMGGDDGATNADAKTAHVANVLVDGCTFTNTTLEILAGTSDITARNCVIAVDYPHPDTQGVGACINLQGADNSHGWRRATRNVLIDSCKGITTTRAARFMSVRGPVEDLRLRNNTYTAPNMVAGGVGSIISAPDPKYIAESTGNTWPDAKADGWANGGLFNLGPDGTGTGHGFWSKAMWLALPGVSGDVFR